MESITVMQSMAGLTGFVSHFLAALLLTALFMAIYVRVTPYPEFQLIQEGKIAPAVSFSGAFLGFVFPLASAIISSISFLDMVVWSLVALVVQIMVFLLLKAMFSNLCSDIADNHLAPAVLLGVLSLGAGILSAACMTF
jgi:putative membrane protein